MTSSNQFSEAIGDATLTFEFIRLDRSNSVGVVRTLRGGEVGFLEQNLAFSEGAKFVRWIEEDPYRHKAPSLFVRIQRKFHQLMDSRA